MSNIYNLITDFELKFADGVDSPSGLAEEAYFIPLNWLKTIATPKPSTTAASLVEILGHHVMQAGKKPIAMAPLYKKSGFKSTLEGEDLSKIYKQGPAEFFIPQLSAENLGTLTAIKNYRGIVLVPRAGATGEFMQIGSKGLAANVVSSEVDLGTGPTGSVGIKVVFEAYGTCPYYIYKGDVPTDVDPVKVSLKSN